MASMIESIREQAQDPDQELSALLGRSVFAATVLRETSVIAWMKAERDGFQNAEYVPDYRVGNDAGLLAWRPGLGWVEAPITDTQRQAISDFVLTTSLTELEAEYEEIVRNGGSRCPLDDQRKAEIRSLTNLDTDLCQVVPLMAVNRVMQTVRFAILYWSEALLEAGVQGQGSSFSAEERAAAAGVAERLEELLDRAQEAGTAAAAEMSTRKGSLLSRLLSRVSA